MDIRPFTDRIVTVLDRRLSEKGFLSDPLEKEKVKQQLRTMITMLGNNLGERITDRNATALQDSVISQIHAIEITALPKHELIENIKYCFQQVLPDLKSIDRH